MGHDICPRCENILDAAASATGKLDYTPKPMDLSICAYCGLFLQFSDDMALVELPQVVFESLPEDTQQELIRGKIIVSDIMRKKLENLKK